MTFQGTVAAKSAAITRAYPFLRRLPQLDPQVLYNILLAYYILMLHLGNAQEPIDRFSPMYFALVVPVLVFIAVQWRSVFVLRDPSTLWLALFAVGSIAVSLLRFDYSTAYNAALLGTTGMVILNSRSAPSLKFLNILFLISLPIAVLTNYLGTNAYSVFPQRPLGCPDEEPWRVSLFSVLPESAFFAVVVFVANLLFSRGIPRYALCALAAYFVLLSAVRTAILGLALIVAFLVLARLISMRRQLLYATYFITAAAALVLFTNSTLLYRYAPNLGSEFVNLYIYRSSPGLQSDQQLSSSFQRSVVWQDHLRLFLDHMPFGSGAAVRAESESAAAGIAIPEIKSAKPEIKSAKPEIKSAKPETESVSSNSEAVLQDSKTTPEAEISPKVQPRYFIKRLCAPMPVSVDESAEKPIDRMAEKPIDRMAEKSASEPVAEIVEVGTVKRYTCSACSFMTEWLARIGVISLFLVLFLASLVARAIAAQDRFLFSACVLFLLMMLIWGVVLVPYNPILLLLFGSVYMAQRQRAFDAAQIGGNTAPLPGSIARK